jgi:probable HAF family extracellular repeat protein
MTADGSVIVGRSYNGSAEHAYKYTDATGMVDLGALGTNPQNYSYAQGMSSDGSVIYGWSLNDAGAERAVIFRIDRGIVDYADWMSSITGANSISSMSNNLEMTFTEGAHHRPMMSYDNLGKKNQVWVTGDFGSSSRTTNSNITTGEVGVSTTLAEGIVGGIAAGYGAQNTDLAFDGSAAIKGNFILGELDYLLPDKQSIFSVLVAYGKWNADTHRGYTVGGNTPDYSNGVTDATTSTVRLRLDGQKQAISSNLGITPFISMSWSQTKVEAYTETDGAYPALFDAQSHTASEGRVGLVASYKLNRKTTLMASAELIHRFDDKATMLTGTDITGAMPFATSSAAPVANQGRFGFDIDQRLDADTLLNFSVHFAGLGASPDVQGALSLRRAF